MSFSGRPGTYSGLNAPDSARCSRVLYSSSAAAYSQTEIGGRAPAKLVRNFPKTRKLLTTVRILCTFVSC
jgi:hypothetical protein